MSALAIGNLREQLVVQTSAPPTLTLASVTQAGGLATATCAAAHGYATGDRIVIAGATPAGYNGTVVATVTGPQAFTFPVEADLASPAGGTPTATYDTDPQGGARTTWRTVATIWAELVPVRAWEQLLAAGLQAQVDYRFRTWLRADLTAGMQAVWTPSWPTGAPAVTVDIHGILPDTKDLMAMFLECGARP